MIVFNFISHDKYGLIKFVYYDDDDDDDDDDFDDDKDKEKGKNNVVRDWI